MLIGIFGALLFLSSIVWLLVSLLKRKSSKIPLISILIGFILFIYGVTTSDTAKEEPVKKEIETGELIKKEPTAKEWVKEREGGNFDSIMADYESLTDQKFKDTVNAQIADETSTIFNKKVKVTGTVIEFVEGNKGFDKGSFIIETLAGNIVRVSAKFPNDAVDIGEQVDVTGKVGMSIDKDDLQFIKDALVLIVID